jgi:hypothetical protein
LLGFVDDVWGLALVARIPAAGACAVVGAGVLVGTVGVGCAVVGCGTVVVGCAVVVGCGAVVVGCGAVVVGCGAAVVGRAVVVGCVVALGGAVVVGCTVVVPPPLTSAKTPNPTITAAVPTSASFQRPDVGERGSMTPLNAPNVVGILDRAR